MKTCDLQTYLCVVYTWLVTPFVWQALLMVLEKCHEGNPSSLLGNENSRMLVLLSTPFTLAPLCFPVLVVTGIEKSLREVMKEESFKELRHFPKIIRPILPPDSTDMAHQLFF